MSLEVPGVGLVPIRWMPASDEDYKDVTEGGRSGYQPIAFVYHRAVANTLHGIDVTFAAGDANPATVGSPGRPVSANFGIGDSGIAGIPAISQYVDVSDTAYCNGDCRAITYPAQPSRWDGWYGHKGHNERTVSIEHDDNGGSSDPAVKGIVTDAIIRTSIELTRLLLTGDIAKIRAAGIRIRDAATAAALAKIVPKRETILDHNDIAGANKPYCWRPWQADKVGIPRTRYITELTAAPTPAPPTTEVDVPQLSRDLPGYTATVIAGVNVRTSPRILADNSNRIRVTAAAEPWIAHGFVKGDVDPADGSDQWLVRWAGRWEYTAHSNLAGEPVAPITPAQLEAAVLEARRKQYDADGLAANADPVVLGPRP